MNVLIIGGGGGIGRAVAIQFARTGGETIGLVGRTQQTLDDAAQSAEAFGSRVWSKVADALDADQIQQAVAGFKEFAGGLDAVIYAAGRFCAVGPLAAVDHTDWWRDVETTLRGFANVVRITVPHLKRSQNPSLTALIGPGHARELAFGTGYGSAQAGLVRLVESLHVELEPNGIRTYAVNPGLVPTSLMNHLLDDTEARRWLPQFTEAFAEGKEVGPEVAAEMIAWLASARPAELSGRVVPALLPPEILATRLERITMDDRGKLRIT